MTYIKVIHFVLVFLDPFIQLCQIGCKRLPYNQYHLYLQGTLQDCSFVNVNKVGYFFRKLSTTHEEGYNGVIYTREKEGGLKRGRERVSDHLSNNRGVQTKWNENFKINSMISFKQSYI